MVEVKQRRSGLLTISGPAEQRERREMLLRELADDILDEVLEACQRVNGTDAAKVARDLAKLRITRSAGRLATLVVEAAERRAGGRSTVFRGVGELAKGPRGR